MLLKKCEKRRHPYVFITIGALALVGVVSIKKAGSEMLKKRWKKMTGASSCTSLEGGAE